MHGIVNPSGLMCALWYAQSGRCFHCNEPMTFIFTPGALKADYATKEHIYPIGRLRGAQTILHHNFVLAHAKCNNRRGAPIQPSDEELTRTISLYGSMGIPAFVTEEDHKSLGHQTTVSKVTNAALERFKADVFV